MRDITGVANDTNTHLRALALVSRLGELPVDARGPVLDAWEDALEAIANPVVLVVSSRDDTVVKWIQEVVEVVGGTGCQATSMETMRDALRHNHIAAILLDADHTDSKLRMITQVRAREMEMPVVFVTAPERTWAVGSKLKLNGVYCSSPALEDVRRTMVKVLRENGRGKAESRRRSKQ